MLNEENLAQNQRIIPQNALRKGQLFHIDWFRWIEAGVSCFLTGYIIYITNFVDKIKLISILVLCISESIFFLRGIKNRSVTHVLFDFIKSRHTRKYYKLGSVNDGRKAKTEPQNNFGGESNLDKLINRLRYYFREFDRKYGTEE